MTSLKLVIGSRHASSWSLRPWLLLKQLAVPFEEIVIPLRRPETPELIRRYSPSGKVPVLLAGGLRIWDSLAIAEYLAEEHPTLWPADREARALARAACCEMHSGFSALRTFMPMDFTARFAPPGKILAPVARDIERIQALWAACRRAASASGPFLFGDFTVADAMYAPVCSRFATYAVRLDREARAYVDYLMALPAMREWGRLAAAELASGEPLPASPPPPVEPMRPTPVAQPTPPRVAAPPPAPVPPPPTMPEPEPETSPPPRLVAVATTAEEPPRGPRPIPSTIMVKPIGDGTRRRR